jgi:hypothetical protein
MSNKVLLSVICFFLAFTVYAQQSVTKFDELASRKNVYVELGGNGIAFNVMYESRFNKSSDGIGYKLGIGGFSGSSTKMVTIPIGLNWLLSKDNKNFFEMGFGATFLHYDEYYAWYWPDGSGNKYPTEVVGLTIDKKNSLFGHMTLGYRRQPPTGGITWGVSVTPQYNQNGFWPIWIGVKFGYSIVKK